MSENDVILCQNPDIAWPDAVVVRKVGSDKRRYVPERTCTLYSAPKSHGCYCSSCGGHIMPIAGSGTSADPWCWDQQTRYCPHCGARVVES